MTIWRVTGWSCLACMAAGALSAAVPWWLWAVAGLTVLWSVWVMAEGAAEGAPEEDVVVDVREVRHG